MPDTENQPATPQPVETNGLLPEWGQVADRFAAAYPSVPRDEIQRTYEGVRNVSVWRARLADSEETTGSWLYRRILPVASAQLNFRNAGYVDTARRKILEGSGTPEDAEVVAVQNRLAESDSNASQGERIASGLASVPAVLGEAFLGGIAGRAIGAGIGLGARSGGTAIATGLEAAAPAAEATGGVLSQFARGAATAPIMPSLYTERAIQNNREAGRDATNWRGFPAAMTLAAIQNGVFSSVGNLAGSAPTGPGALDTTRRLFAQTIGAMAVQQGMDIGTSALDDTAREVFGTSWNLSTRYGVIGALARGQQGEALQDAVTQAITMFAFAGLHEAANRPTGPTRYDLRGRELPPEQGGLGGRPIGPAGPEPVQWLNGRPGENGPLTRYREGMDATRRFLGDMSSQGRSGPEAAAEMTRVMDVVRNIVSNAQDQGVTRLDARQRIMDALPEGPTRDFGLRAVELSPFPEHASSGNMRFPLGGEGISQSDTSGRALEGPQGRPPTFLGQNPDLAPRTLSPAATSEVFGQPGGPLHPEGEAVPAWQPIPGHADYPELPAPIAHAFADALPGARVTSRLDMPAMVSPIAGGTEVIFNPKENSVHIDIGVNKQGVGQTLDRETMGMMRGLTRFLEGIKEQGTSVEYRAIDYKKAGGQVGSRAKVYAKMLERAGFEKVLESKGEFVWKPQVRVRAPEKPLTLYHGTTHEFDKFDKQYAQRTGLGGRGFFFTPNNGLADAFQEATGQGAGPLRTEGKLNKRTVTLEIPRERLLDLTSPEAAKFGKTGDVDAKIKAAGYAGFFSPGGDHVIYDPNEFIVKTPSLLQRMAAKGKAAASNVSVAPTVAPLDKPSLAEIERRVKTGQPVAIKDWFDAAKLTPMERHVLTRMTEDRTVRPTLEEVGAEPATLKLGMRSEPYTKERMRQIAQKAIAKLGKGNIASKLFSIEDMLKDRASRVVDEAENGGDVDLAALKADPKEVHAKVRDRIDSLNAEIAHINSQYEREMERALKAGATQSQIDELNAQVEKEARDAERRLIETGGAGPKARPRQTQGVSLEKLRQQTGFAPAQEAATVTAAPNPAPAPVPQPQRAPSPTAVAAEQLAQFISDESGHLDLDIVRDFVDQYGVQPATNALSHLNTVWRQLAGEGSPKTTDANAAAGEALERFNGSDIYARFAAPLFAEKVLGGDDSTEFREMLGGVLTERSLRYTKKVYGDDALRFSAELQRAISDRDTAANAENQANAQARTHRQNGMPKAAEASEAYARTFAKARAEAEKRAREASAMSAEAIKLKNGVGTIIGMTDSPFQTIDDYRSAFQSPKIQEAIKRHNNIVVPVMDDAFRRSKGMDPADPINSRTQIHGSPVNLKSAKSGDVDVESVIWTKGQGVAGDAGAGAPQRAGRPPNAKLRRNRFSRQRTGASEGYDIDYAKMVEYSLVHQLVNAAKAEAIRTGVEAGIYKWGKPGQSVAFEGENARWGQEFNDVKPPKGTQEDLLGETSLYVHPDQAHEFRRAIEIDEPLKFKTIEKFMGAIMAVNLASTAELTYHAKNQLSFLIRAGFHPVSLFRDIVNVVKGDPATMDQLIELARINTMKAEGFETGSIINQGKYNPLKWGSKLLDLTRKVLLLQGNKAYDRMVKAKLTKGSETGRRNFLNQLGNYNKRSQHKLIKMLRETQIGPFATAGFNYLIQGVRSVLLNPGVKPASMEARLRLRAGMLLRTVAALAVAELINKALWGRMDASDDTPLGAMRVGTDANGRAMYIDLMDLIGLKRGLRVMGLLSLIEGKRKNALPEKIIDKSVKDVVTALVHPLAGPGAQFALTAAYGVDASGFHVAERASQLKHESQAVLNLTAAAEHANPLVGTLFSHSQRNKTPGQRTMELAGPFGIKTAPPPRH